MSNQNAILNFSYAPLQFTLFLVPQINVGVRMCNFPTTKIQIFSRRCRIIYISSRGSGVHITSYHPVVLCVLHIGNVNSSSFARLWCFIMAGTISDWLAEIWLHGLVILYIYLFLQIVQFWSLVGFFYLFILFIFLSLQL